MLNLFAEASENPLKQAFDVISEYFDIIVDYLILMVECIGIVVLIYAVIAAVVRLIKREPRVRLRLAEGIALSLEFKMGGELLRTVIAREWNELLILGAIILLRGALTFLIQWEIRIERKDDILPETNFKTRPKIENVSDDSNNKA